MIIHNYRVTPEVGTKDSRRVGCSFTWQGGFSLKVFLDYHWWNIFSICYIVCVKCNRSLNLSLFDLEFTLFPV